MRVVKNNIFPVLIFFLIVGLLFYFLFLIKGFLLQVVGVVLIIVALLACIFCFFAVFGPLLLWILGLAAAFIGFLLIIRIFIWIF
ncbi:hypothetical protein ABEX08_11675 [Priestia megaterium]